MSDADHHDHHGSVAAEPDLIPAVTILGWGLGLFVSVIASIIVVSAIFFQVLDSHEAEKVGERSQVGGELVELEKTESEALNSYKKLDNGRYQVPIDQAMKLISKEGL